MTIETQNIVTRLREASAGYDEWRVQDPQDGSYIIAFSRRHGALDPERMAHEWLRRKCLYDDYVVACVHVQSDADKLMRDAADEIDRLNAEHEQLLERLAAAAVAGQDRR